MPELDAIRGIAILLVVFYHGYFWMTGFRGFTGMAKAFIAVTMPGWMGVNLFFVLSGFLITGILLDSKEKQNYFASFYTKRALRILPAYYSILLVLLIADYRPRSFVLLSFFFLANMGSFFGIATSYGVLWSLAVEEHFYLLWPSFVRVLSIRTLEYCAAGIACLVPILRGLSFFLGRTDGIHGYTWFEADGLVIGAWLAINVRKPGFTREKLQWISVTSVGVTLLAVLVGQRFGILTRNRLLGAAFQESCGNLIFLGFVSIFLLIGTSKWKSLVHQPILRFYGRISYGLYLVHLLIFGAYNHRISGIWPRLTPAEGHFGIVTLRFVVCFSISTGIAFLSRQYFEEWFLKMRPQSVEVGVPEIIGRRSE